MTLWHYDTMTVRLYDYDCMYVCMDSMAVGQYDLTV